MCVGCMDWTEPDYSEYDGLVYPTVAREECSNPNLPE